MTKIVNLLQPI